MLGAPTLIEETSDMPILKAPALQSIATNLLVGAGASKAEAETVAHHSVEANLTGHDSQSAT